MEFDYRLGEGSSGGGYGGATAEAGEGFESNGAHFGENKLKERFESVSDERGSLACFCNKRVDMVGDMSGKWPLDV